VTTIVDMGNRGSVSRHRGAWRVRATIDGVRKSFGIYDTEEEAEEVLAAVLEANKPSYGLTLRSYGPRYLKDRAADGFHRALHQDESTWRQHIQTAPFIDFPLRRIERVHVARWVKSLARKEGKRPIRRKVDGEWKVTLLGTGKPLSLSVMRSALSLLSVALGDAADDGLIPANPCAGVRLPKRRRATTKEPWSFLTADEIATLLAGRQPLPLKQQTLFTLAIYTGLRQGELLGLRWGDVGRDELVVRHGGDGATKSGKVRRVPLLSPAREAIREWRIHKPGIGPALVFPSRSGAHHADGYDGGWADRYHERVGRKVRFHDLRHTFASHLVMGTWTEKPWPLEAVKEVMGHSSIMVTERYAHLAPGRVRDLAREKYGTGVTTG
jgi:integrase